jgi:hypothetical protein
MTQEELNAYGKGLQDGTSRNLKVWAVEQARILLEGEDDPEEITKAAQKLFEYVTSTASA